jgi:hypothetical protein
MGVRPGGQTRDIAHHASVLLGRVHGADNASALVRALENRERLVRDHADGRGSIGD